MTFTQIGMRVKVKATASGSDVHYAGREGVVVNFNPAYRWASPRALLCPEGFVCVHFFPISTRDRVDGSPMELLDGNNLIALASRSPEDAK
jgi:hypothetical protein